MPCKNSVFLVIQMLFINVCLLVAENDTVNFSGKKNQEPTKAEKLCIAEVGRWGTCEQNIWGQMGTVHKCILLALISVKYDMMKSAGNCHHSYLNNYELDIPLFRSNYVKAGFLEARLQHIEALKHIRKTMNYEKQYKLTYQVFQKLFDVLKTSKVSLENSDYIPGLDFPTNQTVIEALAQLLDNTALYGEFQLKVPDITDRIMKTNNEWMILIKWAIFFSNSTGLYDAKTSTMLNLVCQEMNLIERAESYVNPYRISESEVSSLKQKESPPKKKKIFKKGPRMSKPFHNEL